VGVVKALVSFLRDLEFYLFGQGSWHLHPHERMVIDAAINLLPENAQLFFRKQLSVKTFVQRTPKQICRPRFYVKTYQRDRGAFEDGEFLDKIIDVRLDVDGRKEIAYVDFFKGHIDSIQFRHPPGYYTGKNVMVIGVKLGNVGRTHANAIDRLEHGKNP
jgi:hypothetical protein